MAFSDVIKHRILGWIGNGVKNQSDKLSKAAEGGGALGTTARVALGTVGVGTAAATAVGVAGAINGGLHGADSTAADINLNLQNALKNPDAVSDVDNFFTRIARFFQNLMKFVENFEDITKGRANAVALFSGNTPNPGAGSATGPAALAGGLASGPKVTDKLEKTATQVIAGTGVVALGAMGTKVGIDMVRDFKNRGITMDAPPVKPEIPATPVDDGKTRGERQIESKRAEEAKNRGEKPATVEKKATEVKQASSSADTKPSSGNPAIKAADAPEKGGLGKNFKGARGAGLGAAVIGVSTVAASLISGSSKAEAAVDGVKAIVPYSDAIELTINGDTAGAAKSAASYTGGLAGMFAGAIGGAKVGGVGGAVLGPAGAGAGAIIGGFTGGIAGSIGGSMVIDNIWDKSGLKSLFNTEAPKTTVAQLKQTIANSPIVTPETPEYDILGNATGLRAKEQQPSFMIGAP